MDAHFPIFDTIFFEPDKKHCQDIRPVITLQEIFYPKQHYTPHYV